ncbi:MAG: TPM domain-containing protein, partial [Vicinamibacteria bacterium]
MKVPLKLRNDVSEKSLDAIARAVEDAESATSGEVVVSIVHNLLPFETPRRLAVRAFLELGTHRTRRRNGVLLFRVMKKRRFEIVADDGIDEKVAAPVWQEIASRITETLGREGFETGVCRGVALLGEVLSKHFPKEEGDVDELP